MYAAGDSVVTEVRLVLSAFNQIAIACASEPLAGTNVNAPLSWEDRRIVWALPGERMKPPAPKSIVFAPDPMTCDGLPVRFVIAVRATLPLRVTTLLAPKLAVLPSAHAMNPPAVLLLQVLPPSQLPVPPVPAVAPLASQKRLSALAPKLKAMSKAAMRSRTMIRFDELLLVFIFTSLLV